jgi:hypothetical protein
MCNVILIILRETVESLYQLAWGTCHITWSSRCAVCTVRLFIIQPLYTNHPAIRRYTAIRKVLKYTIIT